jgi:DNA (cytosine-5)-methyltransferase 1
MIVADVYCSAGGTSKGYADAGFTVIGCDINKQPNYPYEFIQMDAMEFIQKYGRDFDGICASPPCQKYSKSTKQWRKAGKEYPDLIEITRKEILKINRPYVLENVPGSPLINPIFLNGYMFDLLVHRPRYFECSFYVVQPILQKTKPVKMGRKVKDGEIIQPVGHFSGINYAKKQMQIDWMTQKELTQAIPPAYTKYIGEFLIEYLDCA